jgi:hypothetical protein
MQIAELDFLISLIDRRVTRRVPTNFNDATEGVRIQNEVSMARVQGDDQVWPSPSTWEKSICMCRAEVIVFLSRTLGHKHNVIIRKRPTRSSLQPNTERQTPSRTRS